MEELIKRYNELNKLYEKSKIEFEDFEMNIILDKTLDDNIKNFIIKRERGKIQLKMIDELTKLRNELSKVRDELTNDVL